MFALLGEIFFEVLTSFEAFRSTSEYRYVEHKIVEAPPRLQWIANELQKISLDLCFHVAFANPVVQMALLRAAAEDHQARALIFGNGVHRGYFVIESLEETHQQLADDGSYIAIEARLELREWVPGAAFDPLASPQQTDPPPGIMQQSASGGQARAPFPQIFDPSQPIGSTNLLPASAIVQLSLAGARAGVTYWPVAYSQPGVSGVAGLRPAVMTPGNPAEVPTSTIVRVG